MSSSQLLKLLRDSSPAQRILQAPERDMGLAEVEPFPFLAIIGQHEMKLALLLSVINPLVGGVLLIGARGTAKTTAVRALTDLLPSTRRSLCSEGRGCTDKILEEGGMEAVCKSCATKAGYGKPLTVMDRVRMVELPLNSRLEDVVGTINERAMVERQRVQLEPGILARADGHLLYIDEVNLLDRAVSNAILDAAAQGYYSVRRGAQNLTYRAGFSLIGSMNPEEGELRPQIMDRFGLRAVVRGLASPEERYRAYQQSLWYREAPDQLALAYAGQTMALAEEIEGAMARLPKVIISETAREVGLSMIQKLNIESSRSEITLFEAARAHTAADGRDEVLPADVKAVSLLALRLRRSPALTNFFNNQLTEDEKIQQLGVDHS